MQSSNFEFRAVSYINSRDKGLKWNISFRSTAEICSTLFKQHLSDAPVFPKVAQVISFVFVN